MKTFTREKDRESLEGCGNPSIFAPTLITYLNKSKLMKKIFTLLTLVLLAVGAQAQTTL